MSFEAVEKIANAVLYEGYILYPYRASSLKNRQRWNFGTLFPRMYAERQSPPEAFSFHVELLVEGGPEATVDACVRFLQLVPGAVDAPEWSTGIPRTWTVEGLPLVSLASGMERMFTFVGAGENGDAELPAGTAPLTGRLTITADLLREGLWRMMADMTNESQFPAPQIGASLAPQASAFTSAHLLLGVEAGAFVSLLEPHAGCESEAAACHNQGVFPVLAGNSGDRTQMLCSPIILYDYPQTAPESSGDFFDGTEMDEMLALRVLTLTDDEKAEMRSGDPQARALLARMETLPSEHLLKLHGAVRGLRPMPTGDTEQKGAKEIDGCMEPWDPFEERPPLASIRIFGVDVRPGDRVRLWPQKKADILDMTMSGKVAIVEAIEQDLEDQAQLAVVLEDDPGRDLGLLRQPGHRFFFSPEEIEPLAQELP